MVYSVSFSCDYFFFNLYECLECLGRHMPIFWSCHLHKSTYKKMLNSFFCQYFRFKLPQENSKIRHLCAGSLIWRRIIFFCKFICRKPKPYIKYKSGKTFFYSLFPIINLYVCLLCSPMFMDLIYKICIQVFSSYCYSIYLGCSLLFCLGFLKWG